MYLHQLVGRPVVTKLFYIMDVWSTWSVLVGLPAMVWLFCNKVGWSTRSGLVVL